MWMNGELFCNEPYGQAKGLRVGMTTKVARLRKGTNLLLVKLRPGYICDQIEFSLQEVRVAPLASAPGVPLALGRIRPTGFFRGSVDAPRQVVEAALYNTAKVGVNAKVSLSAKALKSEEKTEVFCEAGRITTVRLALPAPRDRRAAAKAVYRAAVDGKSVEAAMEYETAEPPKHDGTVMVLSSFHFDTTYTQEQRVYAMGAFDIMRSYCDLHRQDPYFKSTISEIDYLKPYFDVFPEDRDVLLQVFRENRSNADVMYNQPNEQTCDGEALVRNFLYGQLFHGKVLGQICHAYGPGDVFGHPNQLSQIARKSGCMGVTWDKHIYNFPPFFDHLSLDGSVLPHKRGGATMEEVHEMGLSVTTGDIDQTPPSEWHASLMPKYFQATYHDLLSSIHKEVQSKGAHLPVTSRDMSLYHAATAMSRIDLKIANRLGENLLVEAEMFATMANLLGAKYPEKALDKAWRQVLCGQHHDSITGTHNEISYVDLVTSYREILELGTDVLNRSLDYLGAGVDAGKEGKTLVVFNPLAWERTDVVRATVRPGGAAGFTLRDPKGRNVAFEVLSTERNSKGGIVAAEIQFLGEKLPSLGYRAYKVIPAAKAGLSERAIGKGTVIENEFFRIAVDPALGGGIVSLFDKKAKRELINGASGHVGNEIAALEEIPDRDESQHEFWTTGMKAFSRDYAADVELEKGPLSATLRARYALGDIGNFIQEITLTKGVRRIDFKTILVNYNLREVDLFCVTFPTTLQGASPVFEERFGTVVRNDSKNYLDFRTHQMVMFSDCAVYAANKWMEYGACGLLRMGKNAYSLGMIGLISPKDDVLAAEGLMKTFVKKGITCTPWFDEGGPYWGSYHHDMDEDLLYTRFRISLGSRGRNKYTKKLLKAQPAAVKKAFEARLQKNGHSFLFVKDADPADTSWPALPVLIIEGKTKADLDKALAKALANFSETATVSLPAEIDATGEKHAVDNYGIAMLNNANSVEKGGTLCMMLSHPCLWYGGTNNFPEGYLVPEQKHTVFQYALYPHEGDWREADTPREGYAYNYPLIAREVAKPSGKAFLPAEQAFLEVNADNVIVTAMKPFGNPIAAFEKNGASNAAKGIMLRCYETEGRDVEAKFRFATGMKAAWAANMLEDCQGALKLSGDALKLPVPAFSIETVGFEPRPVGKRLGGAVLGAEAEPVQPVWVRSWEHDAETMPMGYMPVVCSISRQVAEADGGKTLKVKVNAVNDYTDAPVSGKALIAVPKGWKATPAVVNFEIGPLGHQTTEVVVTRPGADASGQIKLRYDWDGQTFQDVLELGKAFDLDMKVENRGTAIVVTLTNPHEQAVEAEVAMVTPLETWSKGLVGPYALADISPRTQGISVEPKSTATLTFTVKTEDKRGMTGPDAYWAVAKLMSNGRMTLRRCDNRPPRFQHNAHRWNEQLNERAAAYFAAKKK
jgi:hypothetical protein